jgi:hypothetical protein
MIEVHLVGREPSSAVGAWTCSKLPQEFDRPMLPDTNARDLQRPISFVICRIRCSLIPTGHHSHFRTFGRALGTQAKPKDASRRVHHSNS